MYENSELINLITKKPPKVTIIDKKGSKIKNIFQKLLIFEFRENNNPILKNIIEKTITWS